MTCLQFDLADVEEFSKAKLERGRQARGTHLRMHSRACVKTCGAMPCSCCRIRHCSSVTDMAVRSLALLQLVNRTPLRRRQICQREGRLCLEGDGTGRCPGPPPGASPTGRCCLLGGPTVCSPTFPALPGPALCCPPPGVGQRAPRMPRPRQVSRPFWKLQHRPTGLYTLPRRHGWEQLGRPTSLWPPPAHQAPLQLDPGPWYRTQHTSPPK